MAKLPESNLSNYAVAKAIGASSLDVGTLCTHPNVNKWSKYKPMTIDKATELTEDEKKEYAPNLYYPAPYGLSKYLSGLTPYQYYFHSYSGSLQNEGSTADRINADFAMPYLQPSKSGDEVVNSAGRNIFARLSDFCGYDHNAKMPLSVKLEMRKSETIYEEDGQFYTTDAGLYAIIKRNDLDNADDDTYGGVSLEDLGLENFYLYVIGQSAKHQSVMELGTNNTPRFMIVNQTPVSSTATQIAKVTQDVLVFYRKTQLEHLMGDVNFFAILSNRELSFETYETDGFELNSCKFYPKLSSTSIEYIIPIEGSALQVSYPDGYGTVIWSSNAPFGSDYVTPSDLSDADGGSWTEYYPYIEFKDENTATGVYCKEKSLVLEVDRDKLLKVAHRQNRSLTFTTVGGRNNATAVDEDYLSRLGSTMQYVEFGVYKPLVRNLPVTGTLYANVLLEFASETECNIVLEYRYEGNAYASQTTRIPIDGYAYNGTTAGYIRLSNIVSQESAKSQIVTVRGFQIAYNRTGTEVVYSSTNDDDGISFEGHFPIFPDTLELCMFPDGFSEEKSYSGGRLGIVYDVTTGASFPYGQ